VERETTEFFPKYNRRARQKSHIAAHKPGCIHVSVGDMVSLGETRKLSKTKAWTVLEITEAAGQKGG
jgi:ribosomal protein S17